MVLNIDPLGLIEEALGERKEGVQDFGRARSQMTEDLLERRQMFARKGFYTTPSPPPTMAEAARAQNDRVARPKPAHHRRRPPGAGRVQGRSGFRKPGRRHRPSHPG